MTMQKGRRATTPGSCSTTEGARDRQFVQMLRAYRSSGGLAREAEILERSAACRSPGWRMDCVGSALVCFEWGQRYWLPWFQFDAADMSLRPGPAKVIAELAAVFDGWSMGVWFTEPNMWIGNARPIDLLEDDLISVLGAARADRFIASGD